MRILSHSRLAVYWDQFPKTKSHLNEWYAKTKAARWMTPVDTKATFPDVDRVIVASGNTVYVFNIGGEHRLIAAIHYDFPRVFVLRLMHHKEYDRQGWKKEL